MADDLKTVTFNWSTEYGTCYDCGLPAAFCLTGMTYKDWDLDNLKRCAICAANDAANGESITRLDRLTYACDACDRLVTEDEIHHSLGIDNGIGDTSQCTSCITGEQR